MGDFVKVEIKDEKKLRASLEGFENILNEHKKTILHGIGSKLMTHTTDVFQTEGEAGGGRWLQLKESTVRSREKKYSGRKILFNEGDLSSSIIDKVSEDEVQVGVAGSEEHLGKARAHQFGTDKAGRNRNTVIPARPFLILTDKITKEIEEDIEEYIKDKIEEASK